VKHALALIGIERVKRDVLGVAAGNDAGFIVAPEHAAFVNAAAVFKERFDVL
jgi:hypothetical protein